MVLAHNGTLSHRVIGIAIEIHRNLGPGLLESAYEEMSVLRRFRYRARRTGLPRSLRAHFFASASRTVRRRPAGFTPYPLLSNGWLRRSDAALRCRKFAKQSSFPEKRVGRNSPEGGEVNPIENASPIQVTRAQGKNASRSLNGSTETRDTVLRLLDNCVHACHVFSGENFAIASKSLSVVSMTRSCSMQSCARRASIV